jgi:hypothetical protein
MKVLYIGPSGAVNRDVGRHTGQGDRLVRGAEYDLPSALATELVERSAHWSKPSPSAKKPPPPAAATTPSPKEVTDVTP